MQLFASRFWKSNQLNQCSSYFWMSRQFSLQFLVPRLMRLFLFGKLLKDYQLLSISCMPNLCQSYWVHPVFQIYAKVIEYILYSKFMPKLLGTSCMSNLCQSYWVHPVCQIYAKVIEYILYAKFIPKLLSTSCKPNSYQSYWVHPVCQIYVKVIEYIL